jgi:hypothetical protein
LWHTKPLCIQDRSEEPESCLLEQSAEIFKVLPVQRFMKAGYVLKDKEVQRLPLVEALK